MEPHKQVFLKTYNLTPEKFEEIRWKIDSSCALSTKCRLKDMPECCSLFRSKVENLIALGTWN
ncbi:MAG: hypothetical protein ACD_49C00078G0001 [uncultured bacterium (gcode 4)]|uniref:Uncharacterized protein n=1 Tax=uncultured bacterium (gcode 4) TaxID=1234023 RepID=K2AVF7_9BACT|nr:MAG: hypothetical protein ACD_49C00078G0001 [uncultured bacterium (gcode 4)]